MHRITIIALALFMLFSMSVAQTSVQTGKEFAVLAPSVSGFAADGFAHATLERSPAPAENPAPRLPNLADLGFRGMPMSFELLPTPVHLTEQDTPQADLVTFEGSYVKDLVRLNWKVRQNADALGFAVERRSQADEHWSTVSYQRADTKRNRSGYSYFDHSGVRGVTYYRLRQFASSGKSIPTPAICVMPHLVPNSFVIWQHTVDPFTRFGTVSFGLSSAMPVSVTMIDSYGRNVSTLIRTAELEAGHHFLPFSTVALPSGLYRLRLETAAGVQFQRIPVI
jgi:hypothetical protein